MRPSPLFAIAGILLSAYGCGRQAGGLGGPDRSVRPAAVHLSLGQHAAFTTGLPGDSVTWFVCSDPGGGTVSQTGHYYAPIREPALRTVTIFAKTRAASARALAVVDPGPVDTLSCYGETQADSASRYGDIPLDVLPLPILKVAPVYPDSARETGVEGQVMVQAHLCACGEVAETRIVKSIPMLDAAAMASVSQWIFEPAKLHGEPVAVWVAVPVMFRLH